MSPRTPEQFEQIREDRKTAIIDAAFHVFAEESYHSASVSKIAKRAGVSKGLMYNYFDSKEDLLRAIMKRIMDEMLEEFDFDRKEPLDDEAIVEWVNHSIDIVLKDIKRWRLYMSLSTQPDVTPIFLEMADEPIKLFFHHFIAYFKSKGVDDPVAYARYYSAIVDGIQLHLMMDAEHFPVEKAKNLLRKHITNPIK